MLPTPWKSREVHELSVSGIDLENIVQPLAVVFSAEAFPGLPVVVGALAQSVRE